MKTPIFLGRTKASNPESQAVMLQDLSNETIVTDFLDTICHKDQDMKIIVQNIKAKYSFSEESMRKILREVNIHEVLCPTGSNVDSWFCFMAYGKRAGLCDLAKCIGANELENQWKEDTDYFEDMIWGQGRIKRRIKPRIKRDDDREGKEQNVEVIDGLTKVEGEEVGGLVEHTKQVDGGAKVEKQAAESGKDAVKETKWLELTADPDAHRPWIGRS